MKKTLTLILAALMALTALAAVPVGADDEITSGDWEYEMNEDGVTASITRYIGSATDVTIPSEIDGFKVTVIGYGAFDGCETLTSVTIPDGVTTIDWWVFGFCRSLKSVTIPKSVTEIGGSAFDVCDSLEEIDVDPENTAFKTTDGILYTKDGSELIKCPAKTTLTSVTIPDGVTTIASCAFEDCASLTSASIPEGVTEIPFAAFRSCSALTSVSLPSTLKVIGEDAFRETGLTSVTIPDGVETIEDQLFYECENLKTAVIPDSVTKIGESAFSRTGIEEINIPAGVTEIGGGAFEECRSLRAIKVDPANTSFKTADGVLYSADGTRLICCPAGLKVTSFSIPDGVTVIDREAFAGCWELKSVTIPDSVTEIGYGAFYNCGLEDIALSDSVKRIGGGLLGNNPVYDNFYTSTNNAFYVGNHLLEVKSDYSGSFEVKPGTLTIAGNAFGSCKSLTSVTIPDSVTTIGDDAFYGCTSLTSVTIPDSVTTIGSYAFDSCTSLTTVYYGGSKAQWKTISIDSDNDPLLNANIIFAKEDAPFTPGDANGDGKINSRDVILVMKAVLAANAGAPAPSGLIFDAADLNGDGKLNNRDVIAVMKAVLANA